MLPRNLDLSTQDLSCTDYAALVASYHGSAAAAVNCTGDLKRLVVAQHQYAVPFGPTPLAINNPAFVGAQPLSHLCFIRALQQDMPRGCCHLYTR